MVALRENRCYGSDLEEVLRAIVVALRLPCGRLRGRVHHQFATAHRCASPRKEVTPMATDPYDITYSDAWASW